MIGTQGRIEAAAESLRIEINYVGPSDKLVLPLIVGVGASEEDLGITEFEYDLKVRFRRAYVALVNKTEGIRITRALFDGDFFDAGYAIAGGHALKVGGYRLSVTAGDERIEAVLSREGNAQLRRVILDSIDKSNRNARQQVRESMGL